MKLPIKKKYFDLIKSGAKSLGFRDAHITFVCEETGETLKKEVLDVMVLSKAKLSKLFPDEKNPLVQDPKMFDEEDKHVMIFNLSD